MVVESGKFNLPSGTTLIAKNSQVTHELKAIEYGEVLKDPIVFAQITSETTPLNPATVRVQVSEDSFRAMMQVEEARDGDSTTVETLSWIVVSEEDCDPEGSYCVGRVDGVEENDFAINFRNNQAELPKAFLAQIQTTNGMDTADIRVVERKAESYSIKLEEETSLDEDVDHTAETVGYVAIW